MIIHHDSLDYVTDVVSRTCDYHKRQPWNTGYPGCMCSVSYSQRRATPAERQRNVEAKAEEDERRRRHMEAYDAGHHLKSTATY